MEQNQSELELFAEEMPEQQSLAGFSTFACFGSAGSASCPVGCASSAGSVSSYGA